MAVRFPAMADAIFEDPRLVATYDVFDGPRDDLDLYVAIVAEAEATSVLDVGSRTGVLARRLARRGAGGESVRWIHGDATARS